MHRDQRPERRLAALDLLADERLGDEVEPGAAVLLRDHDPEQPELGHALDHAQVEVVVDVVLDRVRQDALVDERAHGVLNQPLFIGKVEVHGRESMEALRRASARSRLVRARAAGAAGHARLHARHDRRAPAGGGEEGVGEDVTWYAEHHDKEQAAGAILPLAGAWTLESYSDVLEMPDPHRRWAYESAALDLALRQADVSLAEFARP